MIDEKKLIKELSRNSIFEKVTVGEETVYDVIERLPKVGQWIPVSERLPEFNIEVLVCNEDGKIHVALREDDEFVTEWRYKYCCYDSDIWDVEENGEIIAWLPLPEPYKENKGD